MDCAILTLIKIKILALIIIRMVSEKIIDTNPTDGKIWAQRLQAGVATAACPQSVTNKLNSEHKRDFIGYYSSSYFIFTNLLLYSTSAEGL